MKNSLFTLFLCFLFSGLSAQNEADVKVLPHYLFPQFTEGTVKQKSGETNKAPLNYNTVTQEMIFQQGEQQMALDKTENIDTVFIQSKKFIPVGKVFYEVAIDTPVALFIQYQTDIIPPGSETGFGKSEAGAITNVSDLKSSGKLYKLKLPADYKLISKTKYWLKKNDKYISLRNAKDLKNSFPEKAVAINNYLKTNKVNFKNIDEVIKLIGFCNQ